MRLIDADDLHKSFEKVYDHPDSMLRDSAWWFFGRLEDAPTIAPPPNDPLTLEELREMDIGVWVWIEDWNPNHSFHFCGYMQKMNTPQSTVGDGGVFFGWIENNSWHRLYWKDYGTTWLAYHRKPEEGQHERLVL